LKAERGRERERNLRQSEIENMGLESCLHIEGNQEIVIDTFIIDYSYFP